MTTTEQTARIAELAKSVTNSPSGAAMRGLQRISEMLRPSESVIALASGQAEGGGATVGTVVLTSERLMYDGSSLGHKEAFEFRVADIDSVGVSSGLALGAITISVAGRVQRVAKMNKKDAAVFSEAAKAEIDRVRQAPVPTGTAGAPSLIDELSKLGELYRSGILTEEEFVAAKAKLLA